MECGDPNIRHTVGNDHGLNKIHAGKCRFPNRLNLYTVDLVGNNDVCIGSVISDYAVCVVILFNFKQILVHSNLYAVNINGIRQLYSVVFNGIRAITKNGKLVLKFTVAIFAIQAYDSRGLLRGKRKVIIMIRKRMSNLINSLLFYQNGLTTFAILSFGQAVLCAGGGNGGYSDLDMSQNRNIFVFFFVTLTTVREHYARFSTGGLLDNGTIYPYVSVEMTWILFFRIIFVSATVT